MKLRALVSALLLSLYAGQAARAAQVHAIELENQIVSPVTQQYILEAIRRAEEAKAECLLLTLDTPGGLLESTRVIVKAIMNARVPVVVYIGPAGARAGSAGVFITLSSHIAAMAPSTTIGAAHPVTVGGDGGGPMKKLIRTIRRSGKPGHDGQAPDEEELVEEASQDPMAQKILNDTVSWVTTIARSRGRNEVWAAKAVTESVSVGETEAVAERIVDLIAQDRAELLKKLDGWPVETLAGPRTLSTAGAQVIEQPMTARQRFLATITNPTIAYLLMLLGTLGLVFEFTHPGVGFPGIAGLICVILALYAFQTLPINYAGLALLGLGLLLLVAEVKVAGFGLLALGGVVCLTLGSLMLVEAPELRVAPSVIFPVVAAVSLIVLFLLRLALRAKQRPAMIGVEGLIGLEGVAETDLDPSGQVFVRGELWSAVAPASLRKGSRVRVTGVDGLTLRVARHD